MRIGDMLVACGFAKPGDIEEALVRQKETGRRLGEELVASGVVSEVQLTQTLSNQLSIPWVSLQHVEFSRELLSLIPAEMAEALGAIPIYFRRIVGEGKTLFVAMAEPTDRDALVRLSAAAGLPVRPMVAPVSDIRRAINVYYLGRRSMPPPPMQSEPTPETPSEMPEREGNPESAPPEKIPPESMPPAQLPKPNPSRFVTLTLLDGTTVRLPRRGPADTEKIETTLTTSDLVRALLARAQGKEVGGVLGEDAKWETLMATLLSLLIRKGLVADWEFVEAFQQNRGKVDA